MKIVSWNINGIRPRLEQVLDLLESHRPDALCMQEIKIATEMFPSDAFTEVGYQTVAVHGQKAYHGVATVALEAGLKEHREVFAGKDDRRHIAVTFENGVELHNFYVPAGGDVPDRDENEKFDHKLTFLSEMRDWFPDNRSTDSKLVLVGDLNVAPLETDVWNHKQQRRYVGHSPTECDLFQELWDSFDWVDVGRHFVPADEPLHSWWGYRSPTAFAQNKGWRLDHIMVSPALKPHLESYEHLTHYRGLERPSDHLPVVMTLNPDGLKS